MSKFQLVKIYQDTQKICSSFKTKPSRLYDISKLNVDLNNNDINVYDNCLIEIENEDTLDMAIRCKQKNLSPLVLNMASDFVPGGGVHKGSSAQEECIFRRTNAYQTHPIEWYPMRFNDAIYSPKVTIVKDNKYNKLKYYEDISMIAIAAIRKPYLINGKYTQQDYQIMYNKIKAIFEIAIINKHDSLVLGALGCGAFYNPPDEVARIFKILVEKYKKYFKYIGFAVLITKYTDNNNYNYFKNIFV
ncbi:hypothetical protein Catovirus_2_144 [Catovirus CTV1]|uniref:Microbial-type PARG catalytic domain-containing protein n=1 Tax=Catovirus CTV1 TaxID=1977631 RepID=A0A1V0SBV4_9VIRU|nr:hypothetical protein Catovirus_2_144 [Catovirus CTV1]